MYWYLPWVWGMSFWDGWVNNGPPAVMPLDLDDIDFAAELHSEAFARPWSGDEFASLLSQAGTFGFVARLGRERGAAGPLKPLYLRGADAKPQAATGILHAPAILP